MIDSFGTVHWNKHSYFKVTFLWPGCATHEKSKNLKCYNFLLPTFWGIMSIMTLMIMIDSCGTVHCKPFNNNINDT